MQAPTWLLYASDDLRSRAAAVIARTTEWSDRIYWSGYEPLAQAVLMVAAGAAVVVCLLAWTDEKDVQIWSTVTTAGRWMGGLAAVALVLAVCAGRQIVA